MDYKGHKRITFNLSVQKQEIREFDQAIQLEIEMQLSSISSSNEGGIR